MADGRLDRRGAAVTNVQASVADVRVASAGEGSPIVFTAGALSLAMRSTHLLEERQPSIEFVDGTPLFQGLSLAGLPIELELHSELMQLTRWDDLDSSFRTNRAQAAPTPCARACGIYAGGSRTVPGHVLTQPGFGTIYFGEMLLGDQERRPSRTPAGT